MLLQQVQQFVAEHPALNWTVIVGSAAAAWLAPIAALVTIFCALLQAYISWQKYKHWQRTKRS